MTHNITDFASTPMTRRRILGAAAGAAVAAAANLMPPNLRRVLAQDQPREGSLRDIKHVVLLMQENRSFDHYFGTLAGVCGFDDNKALILPSGKSVFHQPDPANPLGYLLPFHLDTRATSAPRGRSRPKDSASAAFTSCTVMPRRPRVTLPYFSRSSFTRSATSMGTANESPWKPPVRL